MIQINTIVFNSFQVNTYLVWDETGECLVVDPAFYSEEEQDAFDAFISDKNLKITGMINTHCHVDHVLGVQYCQRRFNTPFRAHLDESKMVNNAPLMGNVFGLILEPLSGIDEPIEDHQMISIGKNALQAIHVPGHSPGSLSYYSREGGFVITGDALFQGSIGRTDLPGGDYDTLIQSITSRLLVLPSETIVYPGHGPSSTIGQEMAENPFLMTAK
jgi:glyoxylase-like metal-dependent hydrolase (beta-lactamase superfamily II)